MQKVNRKLLGGASLWRRKVGWQEIIDRLTRICQSARGVFADVHSEQFVKKIVKRLTDGAVNLPWRRGIKLTTTTDERRGRGMAMGKG